MVSVLSWIVIFVAAVLLSVNNFGCMLAGVILTNFWLVLDCVDGNIARVKKTKTFMGDFLTPLQATDRFLSPRWLSASLLFIHRSLFPKNTGIC